MWSQITLKHDVQCFNWPIVHWNDKFVTWNFHIQKTFAHYNLWYISTCEHLLATKKLSFKFEVFINNKKKTTVLTYLNEHYVVFSVLLHMQTEIKINKLQKDRKRNIQIPFFFFLQVKVSALIYIYTKFAFLLFRIIS